MVVGAAHGDDLAADARRRDGVAAGAVVTGGHDHHQPGVPGRVDALHQGGIFAHAAPAEGTHGNVHDADPQPAPVIYNIMKPRQHVAGVAVSFGIQHLDRHKAAAGGHAPVAPGACRAAAADDAADVGAVAVVIVGPLPPFHHILKLYDSISEIPVGKNAGVQHGHAHALPRQAQVLQSFTVYLFSGLIQLIKPLRFLLKYSKNRPEVRRLPAGSFGPFLENIRKKLLEIYLCAVVDAGEQLLHGRRIDRSRVGAGAGVAHCVLSDGGKLLLELLLDDAKLL